MIEQWRLEDFKAVGQATSLEFRPLTVFVGPNSSGKSTWIQSILLIAQSLSSQLGSDKIVLNGSLVKLGQFSDLLSVGRHGNSIEVSFLLSTPSMVNLEEFNSILASVRFDSHPQSRQPVWQVRPRIVSSHFGCATNEGGGSAFRFMTVTARDLRSSATDVFPSNSDLEKNRDEHYDVVFDIETQHDLEADYTSGRAVGCKTFDHFIPSTFYVKYDSKQQETKLLSQAIVDAARGQRRLRVPALLRSTFPNELIKLLSGFLPDDVRPTFHQYVEGNSPFTLSGWISWLGELPFTDRIRLQKALAGTDKVIGGILSATLPETTDQVEWPISDPLSSASGLCQSWFASRLRYLGPLRDEPKPLYPLSLTSNPRDVGLRGEHTAAVLHTFGEDLILHVPPPTSVPNQESAENNPQMLQQLSLFRASIAWLQYLDVADEIETADRGKLGHDLRVRLQHDQTMHDLTHVGVGVSQVLPIVVMALIAEPESTLIFEQPELHLHPRVQSRLADFFLAINTLGKQCIIETHSEYIVNRLRLRIALDEKDTIRNGIQIYFSQRESNFSAFESVNITQFGAIDKWPKGFFDESQHEIENIVKAAMKKRMARK